MLLLYMSSCLSCSFVQNANTPASCSQKVVCHVLFACLPDLAMQVLGVAKSKRSLTFLCDLIAWRTSPQSLLQRQWIGEALRFPIYIVMCNIIWEWQISIHLITTHLLYFLYSAGFYWLPSLVHLAQHVGLDLSSLCTSAVSQNVKQTGVKSQ